MPQQNLYFTGREEILESLHNVLKDTGKTVLRQVIAGLGGVGKTATATEYAHRYSAEYSCVLWTLADSETSLVSGFVGFARQLGLPEREKQTELVEDVKQWLSSNTDWLLILDNADNPEVVKPFLPNPCGGSILLTSRAQTFDVLSIKSPIDLGVMTPDEALDFLKERTQRSNLPTTELTAAQELVRELGYFPLALEQAGAYLLAMKTPFTKYLTLYRERHLARLEKKKPVTGGYKGTVATTWTMNFEQVEQESSASADLLRFSAFLAPDDIPLELIETGASAISPTVEAAFANGETVHELLERLTRFSLVRVDAETQTYTIHRLVQMVIQSRMDEPTQAQWAKSVVLAVNQAFPKVEFQNWPQCARLLPQALQAAVLGQQYDLSLLELARLLNQAGY
ncbi:MAG: hypothetical protein HY774_27390 [Acidobacteria bacterium]|nr:hypothetical protein [Acidobacteriota bacterium]